MIFDYLISFIPWLPALSSFSWGPLCRQMRTHKHTTTVKPGSYLNTDSFLKSAHMKHFAFFRFDLWVWIFTWVQWKSGISPWTLFSANLGRRCSKTEASIVLFMLDTWFLSVPVRTPSIPDHSCYVGLSKCCDDTFIVIIHKNTQKAKQNLYPCGYTNISLRICSACNEQVQQQKHWHITLSLVGVKISVRINFYFRSQSGFWTAGSKQSEECLGSERRV